MGSGEAPLGGGLVPRLRASIAFLESFAYESFNRASS